MLQYGRSALMRAILWLSPACLILVACTSLPAVSPGAINSPGGAVSGTASGTASGAPILRFDAQPGGSPPVTAAALRNVQREGERARFDAHLAFLLQAGEVIYPGNDVRLLIDGPATFAALFADIERASKSIYVESYIFEDTAIGQRMATLLKRKQADGVDVRVIYDSIGSLGTPADFFSALQEGGIHVCEFNSVTDIPHTAHAFDVNHRDHRKLVVIDDQVGYTGGINISSVYSSASFHPRKKAAKEAASGWRDTHVRIVGSSVAALTRSFRSTWANQGCRDAIPPALVNVSNVSNVSNVVAGDRLIAVVDSDASIDSSHFYRLLLQAIQVARQSVSITMAYFVPDPQLAEALKQAARRGVRVELVLPGKSDSPLVLRAGQSRYDELLEAGIRIYERHDTYLHAKTVVIDGVWSTVGSSNLDWRSFLHNDEINVVVLGHEFGSEMEKLFLTDVANADEIQLAQWRKRGLARRLQETFSRLWEYWL